MNLEKLPEGFFPQQVHACCIAISSAEIYRQWNRRTKTLNASFAFLHAGRKRLPSPASLQLTPKDLSVLIHDIWRPTEPKFLPIGSRVRSWRGNGGNLEFLPMWDWAEARVCTRQINASSSLKNALSKQNKTKKSKQERERDSLKVTWNVNGWGTYYIYHRIIKLLVLIRTSGDHLVQSLHS